MYLLSRATPMTSIESPNPCCWFQLRTRRPTGLSFGQCRRASVSLTIATAGRVVAVARTEVAAGKRAVSR